MTELHVVRDEFGAVDGVEPTIPKYTRIVLKKKPVKVAAIKIHNSEEDEFVKVVFDLEATFEDASGLPLPNSLLRELDDATRRSAGAKNSLLRLKRDFDEAFYYFEHKGQAVASFNATPKGSATLAAKGEGVFVVKWKVEAQFDKEAASSPSLIKLMAKHHIAVTASPLQRELFEADVDVEGGEE